MAVGSILFDGGGILLAGSWMVQVRLRWAAHLVRVAPSQDHPPPLLCEEVRMRPEVTYPSLGQFLFVDDHEARVP